MNDVLTTDTFTLHRGRVPLLVSLPQLTQLTLEHPSCTRASCRT